MTTEAWLARARSKLMAAGITSAQLDALILLEHVTGRDRALLVAHPETALTASERTQLEGLLAQRSERTPLVHLTGHRQFYGLEFTVTPDVLTPRVETEPMVEQAIQLTPQGGSALDVGTGCGAVAIAIAHHRPDLSMVASDISAAALKIAQFNASQHKVNTKFIQSDLLESVSGRFDTISANLPYLADDAQLMPEVTREPAVALFGGPDGLELYRRFFTSVGSHLNPAGHVIIEADPWQHQALVDMTALANLEPIDQGYFVLTFRGR